MTSRPLPCPYCCCCCCPQNNLRELHALLAFTDPRLFNDGDAFVHYFTPSKDAAAAGDRTRNTDELHSILQPLLLRRTITDVALKLPPLTEIVVRCDLSPMQRKWCVLSFPGAAPGTISSSHRCMLCRRSVLWAAIRQVPCGAQRQCGCVSGHQDVRPHEHYHAAAQGSVHTLGRYIINR